MTDTDSLSGLADKIPGGRWGKVLATVLIVLVAFGAVFGGWRAIIGELDLNTPWEPEVRLGAAIVAGLVGLVAALQVFFDKHIKQVLVVALVTGVVFVAGALVLWFTHEEVDLAGGEIVRHHLDAGESQLHRLRVDPGDRVTLSLTTFGGLNAEFQLERGGKRYFSEIDDHTGIAVVEASPTGGVWEVNVVSLADSSGGYALGLTVDGALQLRPDDSLSGEALTAPDDVNSYELLGFESGEQLVVLVSDFSSSAMMPSVRILHNGSNATIPPGEFNQPIIVQVPYRQGREHILTVGVGGGGLGAYSVSLRTLRSLAEPSVETTPRPGATPIAPSALPTPLPTTPASALLAIPDVYDVAVDDAENELVAVGFVSRSIPVCSDSVARDRVRQVIIVDAEGKEIIVVDREGPIPAQANQPAGAELIIKRSTGVSCDPYVQLIHQAQPVAYWPLTQLSTQIDGFDLDLPPDRRVTLTDRLDGTSFGGSTTDRLDTSFNPSTVLSSAWSVEAWMSTTSRRRVTIIGGFLNVLNGDGSDRRWYLALQAGRPCAGVGALSQQCASEQVADGDLHHVALTYDSGSGTVSQFLDGALIQEFTPGHAALIDIDVAVGAMWVEDDTDWQEPWTGAIGHVAVYDRALDPDEIRTHAVAGN